MKLFEETEEQQRERHRAAIEFASRYARSFDPELLNYWYKQIVERTLPPTASHSELAADNALRAFVVGIVRQHQFAVTGSLETPWQKIQQPPPQEPKPRPRRRKRKT